MPGGSGTRVARRAILVRERDLFGQWGSRWQVIRTSNAYVFTDPKPQLPGGFPCKSENPAGTQNQEVLTLSVTRTPDPNSPLERALRQLDFSGQFAPLPLRQKCTELLVEVQGEYEFRMVNLNFSEDFRESCGQALSFGHSK